MYGMRKRECLDLEWIDINLKKGSIRLSKTKTKVPRTIYVDDEKKGIYSQEVPIFPITKKAGEKTPQKVTNSSHSQEY